MTEKRFEYLGLGEYWDNQEDYGLEPKEVTELLNGLNDGNEQLRHDATILIQSNQDYRKENEQLKTFREQNINEYNKLKKQCNQCKNENELLRTALKELKEIGDYQADRIQELSDENEQLKKALWCIRKRYGYTIEEFVEDLKDNGTDLSKVDLK